MYAFKTLNEVRELTEYWMKEYNEEHSPDALNDLTPWEYLMKHEQAETSNYGCN